MNEFRDLLCSVCMRPAIHVGGGSFPEVAAWLNGYASGAGGPENWRRFGYWLAHRLNRPPNLLWKDNLLDHCGGDEKVALGLLPSLYDEFLGAADR